MIKTYNLMHKNKILVTFELNTVNSEIDNARIYKKYLKFLPLPLRKLIYLKNNYAENENNTILALNEEGNYLLEDWLRNRAIPSNRENLHKYINKNLTNSLRYALDNNSVSLTDCYWTKDTKLDSNKVFSVLRGFCYNDLTKLFDIKDKYSPLNCCLGGMLEKYWFYTIKDNKKQLMLAKRTDLNNSILNIREVIVSKIYELQGFKNYCQYKYIRNNSKQIVGVKCKAFTSENLELVTVYDLLNEFNETQHPDVYNNIIKRASAYGADPCKVANQLDIQTLVDYLITNRDRHQNNIGFLRNPENLKIIDIAPIFDSGSSKYLEGEKPESVLNTSVHNLYNTEIECLSKVKNIKALDLTKLPSNKWILNELRKAENLSEYRIQFMYQLYKDKVKYLKELQDNIK